MNLIFRVIYAAHCRSTHHKLALDALRHLEGVYRQRRQRLFLKQHEVYLAGAKDPDTKFRDFENHVLHVEQDYWGGAPKAARKWCDRMVGSLQRHNWPAVVYSAGVLSHYYTDPIRPFHTGQSQAETNIHRAAQWSITKSYDELQTTGRVEENLPEDDRTVRDLVAAECSPATPSRPETVVRHSLENAPVGHAPVESKSKVQTPDRSKSAVRESPGRRQSQPASTRKIDVTRTSERFATGRTRRCWLIDFCYTADLQSSREQECIDMSRSLILIYGILSYAVGMGGLVFFILFVGGWEFLPFHIDSGEPGPLAVALSVNMALMILLGGAAFRDGSSRLQESVDQSDSASRRTQHVYSAIGSCLLPDLFLLATHRRDVLAR